MRDVFEAPTGAAGRASGRGRAPARAAGAAPCARPERIPLSSAQRRLWFLTAWRDRARRLQHPARPAPDRAARRWTRCARRSPTSSPGTRRCAPSSPDADGEPVPADPRTAQAPAPLVVDGTDAERAARRGIAAAVRPASTWRPNCRCGPACSRLGAERARAAPRAAPHRRRRLVDGAAAARPGRRLSRPAQGRAPRLGAAARAVRRLRALAARRARRRATTRTRADRPARPTGRRRSPGCPDELAAARRPPAPGRATPPRRRDHRCALAAAVHRRLLELARQHPATVFMVAAGGAGRAAHPPRRGHRHPARHPRRRPHRRALDDLVGFFVNTLVLRTDTSGDPTFTELLQPGPRDRPGRLRPPGRARSSSWWRRVNPTRSPHRHPLFQVMLASRTPPDRRARPARPARRQCRRQDRRRQVRPDVQRRRARTPRRRPGGSRASLEYATDLFDPATVERLAAGWQRCWRPPPSTRHRRIRPRPARPSRARRCSPSGTTPRQHVPGAHRCPQLFAAQAARTPHAHRRDLRRRRRSTYAELNAPANRLARHLIGAGRRDPSLVALACRARPTWWWPLLAVLKAGAAYLPVDPAYPATRLAYMLPTPAACVLDHGRAALRPPGPCPRCWTPDGAALAAPARDSPTPTAPPPLAPATRPTSSTPPAPPAAPRASSWSTARSTPTSAGRRAAYPSVGRPGAGPLARRLRPHRHRPVPR